MRIFTLYILASPSRTLYTGVTGDLIARLYRHRAKAHPSFSARYDTTRLVYYETTENPLAAIAREKQLKRWPRRRKIRLIERHNAGWVDLSADWFPDDRPAYDATGNP